MRECQLEVVPGSSDRGKGESRTAVDDLVLVEIVDSGKDLLDSLGGVLLGELALLADAVEKLSACRQLGDNVELILCATSQPLAYWNPACPDDRGPTYS